MSISPSSSLCAACAALLLLGTGSAVSSASGEELAQELKRVPYQILFESYQNQNWDLYLIHADGSARVDLTHTQHVNELCPHVSADGTKVCFLVDAGEGEKTTRDVYSMNVDGTARRLVVRGARDPCWTADNRGIVYVNSESEQFTLRDFATKGLFVYDLASSRARQHPNQDLHHLFAICSTPDGKWYVATVHAGMGYAHAILAIEAQGQKVFDLRIPGCRPDVSCDGKRIAWASSDYSLGVGELDLAGPEPRVVNVRNIITSEKPWKVQHVDWSPDGKYVAFSRGPYKEGLGLGASPALVGAQAPKWDICVADATATNRWVAITTDGHSNKEPDWVPIKTERQ
jgi:Tol biopolymer transport system component